MLPLEEVKEVQLEPYNPLVDNTDSRRLRVMLKNAYFVHELHFGRSPFSMTDQERMRMEPLFAFVQVFAQELVAKLIGWPFLRSCLRDG